jgi:ribosome-associated translation inhibitor RaiA
MKIQLNSDGHVDGTEALTAQVTATVEQALAPVAGQVTRVEVHLRDESGARRGPTDQRCLLEARLQGRQPVAVTDHAATPQQAVQGAAHKLARLLDSRFGRLHDARGPASGPPGPGTEPAPR